MNFLFSRSSLMILESLSFTRTLYAFDFDGTLSPIVKEPEAARMREKTEKLLRELCKVAPVAVVSGRSLSDLKKRLPLQPRYLVGNHGLEGLGLPARSLESARATAQGWKRALARVTFEPGVEIEDKVYSLAIHFRKCRKKKNAKASIRRAVEGLDPVPRVIGGKSVLNLLPKGAPHKGAAVLELMKRARVRHFFYIGDDDTDEDVFSLPEGESAFTVRVGEKRASRARYFIKRQDEINKTLECLLRFYGREKP